MHRVAFHYTLEQDRSSHLIHNPLFDLLLAVDNNGSISAAARELELSYRHVWGELKRWEKKLEHALIVWEKGQPARLTEFGTKLLWAERQAQARLLPQIERLRADLERAFSVVFDDDAHVLSFYASHDEALSALREHGLTQQRKLHLDIRFTGSVDAIRALNEGRCMMAGFHTREQPARGSRAQRTYKPMLKPGLHKIIGFTRRTQGLIVAPGNPLQLRSLEDVAKKHARFANRVLGSGTRLLIDELLDEADLLPDQITGYDNEEMSHASVAQAIAAGQADAGLGIAATARACGLDFVPLVEERYHLACLKSALDEAAVQAFLELLRCPQWQQQLDQLPGYEPEQCGEVLAMSRVLPWWRYRTPKY